MIVKSLALQVRRLLFVATVLVFQNVWAAESMNQVDYPDPSSFAFEEAVEEPARVIQSQQSTVTYGNHPRATDDPLFIAQELLGRPTDTTITINAVARQNLEAFYEYGTASGSYTGRTDQINFLAEESMHQLIEGLEPNTQYYYRMRYREPGDADFSAREEHSFHTQRPPGNDFSFVIQADPHMLSNNSAEAYELSLNKMLADQPDFMLDLGDTFFIDRYLRTGPLTRDLVMGRVQLMRSYFDLINHSVPLFLVNGNHEGEWSRFLDGTANNMAVLGTLGRKEYFPNPEPNDFYTGGTEKEEFIGLRQANYAWEWGDALFIALDPYWNTASDFGRNDWAVTLGEEQYWWFRETLENSDAKYTFVFAHNLIGGLNMRGQMRGGIETTKYKEMGGHNLDGTWGFDDERPGWGMPIHQLLVANKKEATIFFTGHDHLYVHQEQDGIVYQATPVPATRGLLDVRNSAINFNYNHGTVVNGGGYLRVNVSSEQVEVEYVRTFLPEEENEDLYDGMIGHRYSIQAE
jgi:hypothetical protein